MATLVDYPEYNERTEYSVPDGVTVIQSLGGNKLHVINIPASVSTWSLSYANFDVLEEINVDPDNTAFMSIDGVLFNKSGDTLIKYPKNRVAEDNTYRIPDGVTTIVGRAFNGFRITYNGYDSYGNIIFPASVTTIDYDNCFFSEYYYQNMNLYFEGDAPLDDGYYSWNDVGIAEYTTVYYTAGKNGWTSPTWNPSYKYSWSDEIKSTNMYIPSILQDAYATVSGQVVDANGNPLENVVIQGKYDDKLTGVAYTDADGNYTFQFESATTCNFRYVLDGYETVYVDLAEIVNGEYSLDTVTMTTGVSVLGSGVTGGGNNWTLQGNELIITRGENNSSGKYYLSPYDVEDISAYSFWSPNDMKEINKINIGEGITKLVISDIGDDLSVKELYIGVDVSEIDWRGTGFIWDYKYGRTDIAIDPANTNFVITDNALYTSDYKTLMLAPKNDYSVMAYSIREGVEVVGEYAFYGSNYKSINVSNTVTTLKQKSFRHCDMESIHISESVKIIESNVFKECNRLTTISVDTANTEYEAVDKILYNKSQTKLIAVPCALTGSLTIPDGVISIGEYAMDGTNLDCIIVPASVEKFDNHAVSPYYNIKCKVYFLGNVPEVALSSTWYTYGGSELTLYYLEGISGWSTPTTTIGGMIYNTKPFTMDELD